MEFLRLHAPSKCNVFFGGFLFGGDGSESSQLDVIVTTDTTPRFNFYNSDGSGKSFAPVEGTLAVASIKSFLDKRELENALTGLASIPPTEPLGDRVSPMVNVPNYDEWPYKIIYASDGVAEATLARHLDAFYTTNSNIPLNRRPHCIHVAGKYVIFRAISSDAKLWDPSTNTYEFATKGSFRCLNKNPDLQAVVWVLDSLQQNATASTHILFSYKSMLHQILGVPRQTQAP